MNEDKKLGFIFEDGTVWYYIDSDTKMEVPDYILDRINEIFKVEDLEE